MLEMLIQLALFTAKAIIIVLLILILVAGILSLFAKGKEKPRNRITIRNINKKYAEITDSLLEEILPKSSYKKYLKDQKQKLKSKKENSTKNIYVIDFEGDIKGTAVGALREEITAILCVATPKDEVVVRLDSAGGLVHTYGLAASQLIRLREQRIPLTICVDKIAASGGYLMAAVANKILAAPFAIIGSVGVVVQLPNFHRLLKDKHIDFEQITAGKYKRTLTMFGENTKEGREKMHEEVEDVHHIFKNLIQEYRKSIDIEKIATGEHWLAKQAIEYHLVDELTTSDDYLFQKSSDRNIYEVCYLAKKSLGEKLFSKMQMFKSSNMVEENNPIIRI